MVKVNISILGSCVSRDSFKFANSNYELVDYYARSSIVSVYSAPLKIKMEEINLPSNFQKRMVYYDLNKAFRTRSKAQAEYLLIDLIDERFRLLKYKNTFITRSNEYLKAQIGLKTASVSPAEVEEQWYEKAALFCEDVKQKYGAEKIILHKALWRYKYKNKNGEIVEFENKEDIIHNNELLNMRYSFLEDNIEGVSVIQLTDYLSDESHIWGLSPFHYEDAYYEDFVRKMDSITSV
ncbi:UNVERIFIED_CONTAM: DUF6270 domain-containing protein [Halobacillus marinus]